VQRDLPEAAPDRADFHPPRRRHVGSSWKVTLRMTLRACSTRLCFMLCSSACGTTPAGP
jgi:hypothetical protein